MSEIVVRKADENDVAALAEILVASFKAAFAEFDGAMEVRYVREVKR